MNVNAVLQRYTTKLQGLTANRFTLSALLPSASQALQHCLWMCTEIPSFVKEGREAKAMRWLGFIQGVLWATGRASIEEMKEDNRD